MVPNAAITNRRCTDNNTFCLFVCISFFSTAVIKLSQKATSRRKGLFRLTVPEATNPSWREGMTSGRHDGRSGKQRAHLLIHGQKAERAPTPSDVLSPARLNPSNPSQATPPPTGEQVFKCPRPMGLGLFCCCQHPTVFSTTEIPASGPTSFLGCLNCQTHSQVCI